MQKKKKGIKKSENLIRRCIKDISFTWCSGITLEKILVKYLEEFAVENS